MTLSTTKHYVLGALAAAFLAFGFSAPAHAQPTSGADCNPTTGPLEDFARAVRDALNSAVIPPAATLAATPAATPAPKAKDFAETVMKTVLADKDKKDRWGYTSHTGDGCFARSYATNYDMATGRFGAVPAGLKFKTVYIHWKPTHRWSYHTAAVVSGPDGDFVIDGLNGKVLTVDEWVKSWESGADFDHFDLQDGLYMYPGETHDGKPNLERRKDAHDVINRRKKLKGVTEYPYEP